MNPSLRPLSETAVLAATAFAGHALLLHFIWPGRTADWHYPIVALYGFFSLCSLFIAYILGRTKVKNIDSVGSTFMLLTCIKAVLAYVLLHPVLTSGKMDVEFEKMNFFAVFAIFLTIETVVSVRLLQKK
ncbi:hypothetical protein HYN48_03520 [Flavobacterium magnum]|uniref:Uncharacterized protein n=1 Tax=Flavobacterium magnum TaxID=2162713 RepID=A0A2S0RD67_9FLAO|nr:hypothetical protein [Flavobacterium magnum]AWA29230.1 hypothetical protein HYN48_03520 [Flavobacterium magnum]